MGSAAFASSVPASGSAYLDVQSGDKVIIVKYDSAPADTFRATFETELKQSYYIIGTKSGARQISKVTERYTWQSKGSSDGAPLFPSDTASVQIFNGSPDAGNITVTISGGSLKTDTTFSKNATFGGNLHYLKLKAASYTITFTDANSDTLSTLSQSLSAANRYTAAFYGVKGNYHSKLFTDD